jgi:hypothetical protein
MLHRSNFSVLFLVDHKVSEQVRGAGQILAPIRLWRRLILLDPGLPRAFLRNA